MSDLTPEKLAELRQLLHSGPRDCAIGMLFVDNAEALLDAAAERDALAAAVERVRAALAWLDMAEALCGKHARIAGADLTVITLRRIARALDESEVNK